MSKEAKKLSESGFYHIVFRGINHQNIFDEEQDFEYMIEILKKLKQEMLKDLGLSIREIERATGISDCS